MTTTINPIASKKLFSILSSNLLEPSDFGFKIVEELEDVSLKGMISILEKEVDELPQELQDETVLAIETLQEMDKEQFAAIRKMLLTTATIPPTSLGENP